MNFSPRPLRFRRGVWQALISDLRARGEGVHETGAFLLANADDDLRQVSRWISYEDLEPGSCQEDLVRLSSQAFSRLWAICQSERLIVLADIHTHPLGAGQSRSDRANPMVSMPGHVAIIVPRFALGPVSTRDVTFNVYMGGGEWHCCAGYRAEALLITS